MMETLGEKTCLVSDLGLREGVLLNLAGKIRDGENLIVKIL